MKITLLGRSNYTGIGTHFSGFCRALRERRPDLDIVVVDPFDPDAMIQAMRVSDHKDITINFVGSNMRYFLGRRIQWVPFESTRIPDVMLPYLKQCDEIWTMTAWGRDILVANGQEPHRIHVVHQGLDDSWQPQAPPTGVWDFLVVGKYEQRKGIDETLLAWSQSLINDPRCQLTIKTHATTRGDVMCEELVARIRSLGIENWRMMWGVQTDDQVRQYYHEASVFLLPSRAEGWGRPIMEAAAMDLPIMTTQYSAHGEWLQPIASSVVWIDYDMVDIDDPDYRTCYGEQDHWGQWAQPSVEDLAQKLRGMPDRLADLRTQARINGQWIRQHYQWSGVVDRALEVLGI